MNFGFDFVQRHHQLFSRCIVFHDVDLVPEDDRNMYSCAQYPKHMSPAVNKFNYEYAVSYIFNIYFKNYIVF